MATYQKKTKIAVDPVEIQLPTIKRAPDCPQTGKPVVKYDFESFKVPGGQATWWHCPLCQGWHVIIET